MTIAVNIRLTSQRKNRHLKGEKQKSILTIDLWSLSIYDPGTQVLL